MRKLNLYKIIGIFLSFVLFLVIFNQIKNGEPNFKVDESLFEVYESTSSWEEAMENSVPQTRLARELGALGGDERRIPLLSAERDLIIHDAMVLNYGAVYLTYSFSLKESDQPYNLPRLHIGSVSFTGIEESNESYLVSQQNIAIEQNGKPHVVNHRIYQADILMLNHEAGGTINELNRVSSADSVFIQDAYVQGNDEKVNLENQELSIESDYAGNVYAETDLNKSVKIKDGELTFSHFEAGLNMNKLYIKGKYDPQIKFVITNTSGENPYSIEYDVREDKDGSYLPLEPFQAIQKRFSYRLNEVIFNKDGSISKTIAQSDLEAMEKGEKVTIGEYSGISYTVHLKDDGQQLVISFDTQEEISSQFFNQFDIESRKTYEERFDVASEEERQLIEARKPILLELKDDKKSSILIYQTRPIGEPNSMQVDLDHEHFTSGLPVSMTLSNLPEFQSINLDISGLLKMNEKK